MSRTRVAAVITFYRDDAHFPEALASVLAQTRPPDEIVVVDDGSPPEYARTLERLDSRVRLVRAPRNGGPGMARQVGAAATSSELICYLDADDIWLPTKLERQLDHLAGHPEFSAHHVGLITFRPDGRETMHLDKPAVLDLGSQLRRNRALPSAYCVRRAALDAVGGWSPDRALTEDWDLNIRLVAAGHRVGFLAEPLVRFRRAHQGNLSARGYRQLAGNLRTIRTHAGLFRQTLGTGGTVGVIGRVIHDEGSRRGGVLGLPLRAAGRLLGLMGR